MSDRDAVLPDGSEYVLSMSYTAQNVQGVTVLVVVSVFSLIAVVGLLLAIALSAFNTRSSRDKHLFIRTHVAAYFISLLLGDLIQTVGSIMNARWTQDVGVVVGDYCTLQGVLKQMADVATAFWTFIIAIHTFCLVFLNLRPGPFVLCATLVGGWSGIATVVIAGPAALNTARHGPFYGISGYWCWISASYSIEHATLDYMFMFMASISSFVLYMLIFLRLRGNVVVKGWRISFRRAGIMAWKGQVDHHVLTIAKQMLLYPVAYTILILPIAAVRFTAFAGHGVPFEATIFCDSVFLLSGVVNVTLFTTTRRILPRNSFSIPKWSISQPRPHPKYSIKAVPFDSDYRPSGTYNSYEEKEKGYASDADSVLGPVLEYEAPGRVPAPPSVQRESGESVYSLYKSTSPISLIPSPPVPAHPNAHWVGRE